MQRLGSLAMSDHFTLLSPLGHMLCYMTPGMNPQRLPMSQWAFGKPSEAEASIPSTLKIAACPHVLASDSEWLDPCMQNLRSCCPMCKNQHCQDMLPFFIVFIVYVCLYLVSRGVFKPICLAAWVPTVHVVCAQVFKKWSLQKRHIYYIVYILYFIIYIIMCVYL